MNRQGFLSNVRHSLQSNYLPVAQSQTPPVQLFLPFDPYDLAAPFTEQALAVKGEVHQVTSHAAGCQRVCDILAQHQAMRFIGWRDDFLPIKGLNNELAQRGFQCQDRDRKSVV